MICKKYHCNDESISEKYMKDNQMKLKDYMIIDVMMYYMLNVIGMNKDYEKLITVYKITYDIYMENMCNNNNNI
jgi:hypothetical protein